MTIKDSVTKKDVPEEADQFGEYSITQKLDKQFGHEKLLIFKTGSKTYGYQRYHKDHLEVEKVIACEQTLKLGIFPVAPIHTPQKVADHVMLKLVTPLVLDPQAQVDAYLTMPIEIGVIRSSVNEMNIIDAFSVGLQYYAIYGTPENGVLCRYHLTTLSSEMPKATVYQEAVVRVHFINNSHKVITIIRIVFPLVEAHFHCRAAEAYYNDLDMVVSEKLSNLIAGVRLSGPKLRGGSELVPSETLLKQNFRFIMEWGF